MRHLCYIHIQREVVKKEVAMSLRESWEGFIEEFFSEEKKGRNIIIIL